MIRIRSAVLQQVTTFTFLALSGCSTAGLSPPAQPSAASVAAAESALAAVPGDPATVLASGVWAVHVACDAYLNAAASRDAGLSLAGAGLGTAGVAAAGFLATGGNPIGAAAATGLTSLAQTFLGEYRSSGALPYTSGTTTLVQNSMAAYEGALPSPASTAEAMLEVEGDWWQCSPGGYAQNVEKAAETVTVTAGAPGSVSFALARPAAAAPALRPPPIVRVNGR